MEHIKTLATGFITIVILFFISWLIVHLPQVIWVIVAIICFIYLSYTVGWVIRKSK